MSKLLFIWLFLALFVVSICSCENDITELDGQYCAVVKYSNASSGKSSVYNMPIEINNGKLTRLIFPSGALSLDEVGTIGFDKNHHAQFYTEKGIKYSVQVDNSAFCNPGDLVNSHQCEGLTGRGERCLRKVRNGAKFCYQHDNSNARASTRTIDYEGSTFTGLNKYFISGRLQEDITEYYQPDLEIASTNTTHIETIRSLGGKVGRAYTICQFDERGLLTSWTNEYKLTGVSGDIEAHYPLDDPPHTYEWNEARVGRYITTSNPKHIMTVSLNEYGYVTNFTEHHGDGSVSNYKYGYDSDGRLINSHVYRQFRGIYYAENHFMILDTSYDQHNDPQLKISLGTIVDEYNVHIFDCPMYTAEWKPSKSDISFGDAAVLANCDAVRMHVLQFNEQFDLVKEELYVPDDQVEWRLLRDWEISIEYDENLRWINKTMIGGAKEKSTLE